MYIMSSRMNFVTVLYRLYMKSYEFKSLETRATHNDKLTSSTEPTERFYSRPVKDDDIFRYVFAARKMLFFSAFHSIPQTGSEPWL